ncbi:phosphopantetheinyl transferase [Janthinobacterium sp. ROICE36]|uniref:4'-phosphopantetheinyl transferase family protein n=1 Tax=Janthinobacterium sp. ROICE36 TaxID=2048670 RepID=UPI000C7EAF85|nr:4'-phosphopantetheinyl transferase superfamily protein [Janthinobacterium sp. ROICE36]PLY40169.1 phosphopantetheinyl transferase [Janthinobacterium sp. ROICE36]
MITRAAVLTDAARLALGGRPGAAPHELPLNLYAASDVPPSLYMLRYSVNGFDSALFNVCGVECPAHIARSVAKRQSEYFYGRLCARSALDALGVAAAPVTVGGMGEPIWPGGVCGSITHNREYALAVAVRRDGTVGIGIDVESIADQESCKALMAVAVAAEELAYLRGLETSLSLACLLTMVFSAKESFFKACFTSVRRYLEFDAVRVRSIEVEQGVIELVVQESLGGPFHAGYVSRVRYQFLDPQTILTYLHC